MSESWKPVDGYEGVYEVSDHGNVRRVSKSRGSGGGVLALKNHTMGYLRVTLSHRNEQKQVLVHRLVCRAFNGPPSHADSPVNHIDGDRQNNRPANLEWTTPTTNNLHSRAVLGNGRKLSDENIVDIRKRYAAGSKQSDLAVEFGVSQPTIGQLVTGVTWPAVGGPITKVGRGSRRGALTDAQVRDIRARYDAGENQRELGEEYGLSGASINRIGKRIAYRAVK